MELLASCLDYLKERSFEHEVKTSEDGECTFVPFVFQEKQWLIGLMREPPRHLTLSITFTFGETNRRAEALGVINHINAANWYMKASLDKKDDVHFSVSWFDVQPEQVRTFLATFITVITAAAEEFWSKMEDRSFDTQHFLQIRLWRLDLWVTLTWLPAR